MARLYLHERAPATASGRVPDSGAEVRRKEQFVEAAMARISTYRLAQLCRRASAALHAGVDARTVWQQEAQRGPPGHRQQLAEISRRINSGDTIAEAMRASNGYFPLLTCELVDVGEQTGRLERVLARLADHYDHLLKLKRAFLAAIAWPMIQLVMAVFVIGLLIWILGALGGQADVLGLGLTPGQSLVAYVFGVIVLSAAVALPIVALRRGWLGPYPMWLVLQLPVVGRALQTIALSRMAWALAMAIDAGLDARRSVRLALATTQNLFYTSHADEIDRVILRGGQIHEALRASGAFPEEFLDTVENGELTGQLSESLEHLANTYRDRAQASSGILVVLASFAIWGLVAMVLIFMIVRLFMILYLAPIKDALQGL